MVGGVETALCMGVCSTVDTVVATLPSFITSGSFPGDVVGIVVPGTEVTGETAMLPVLPPPAALPPGGNSGGGKCSTGRNPVSNNNGTVENRVFIDKDLDMNGPVRDTIRNK